MAGSPVTHDELLHGIVHAEMAVRTHMNECRKCRRGKRCATMADLGDGVGNALDEAVADHVGPGICLGCFKPLDDHERAH